MIFLIKSEPDYIQGIESIDSTTGLNQIFFKSKHYYRTIFKLFLLINEKKSTLFKRGSKSSLSLKFYNEVKTKIV